jgi:hypothetical protein
MSEKEVDEPDEELTADDCDAVEGASCCNFCKAGAA